MTEIRILGNGFGAFDSLCTTCSMGMVVVGPSPSQHVTRCRWGEPTWEPPFAVSECTAYVDRRQPDLYDMKEVAHVLVRGQRGKRVGFVTPDQYRELQTENDD